MSRPSLLVLSFSPIVGDARVLRQVRHLVQRFEVVTCGYGPAPEGVVEHLRLPEDRRNGVRGKLLLAKAYRALYRRQDGVRAAAALLRGRPFDLVLANDTDALPLALSLRPRYGVHSDLHEYFPLLHEDNAGWRRHIAPYESWICRRFLPRAGSVTTVSGGLAREYTRRFGVDVGVVTNASPYADLAPTPTGRPIRLVHSGTSHRARNLMAVVDAVAGTDGFTLDLYLTPNDPAHLDALRERAAGLETVTVHDPVPYADLVRTLNAYDVGIFVLPPATFSLRWALPNKVYDFLQARLALVIGPSPEMVSLVERAGNGVVTDGYDADAIAATLAALDPARVDELKAASHAAAHALAAETESGKWEDALLRLLPARAGVAR